jgi:N-acetyl-D-muramate 6-phosphate phosphatase
MNQKIRAVIFDLDGTLLDTAPDFIVVVNQLLAEEKHPALAEDKIRQAVSNGSKALIRVAFAIEETHPDFEPLRARLLQLYLKHIAVYTKPFPGIQELLHQLADHHIRWGIATNKPSAYTLPLMRELNMQPAPSCIICPDHVSRSKPDPECLFLAAKHLRCTTEEIMFIGDHKRDIDCGKSANSITIAAAYGYLDDAPEYWNADYCVNHASEIWSIVKHYL